MRKSIFQLLIVFPEFPWWCWMRRELIDVETFIPTCSYLCTLAGTSQRSWLCWNVVATPVGRSPFHRWTGSSAPASGWWCLAARHRCSWSPQVSQQWHCSHDLCSPKTLRPWQRRPAIINIQTNEYRITSLLTYEEGCHTSGSLKYISRRWSRVNQRFLKPSVCCNEKLRDGVKQEDLII